MGRMVDDVVDQPQEAVDKFIPRTRLVAKAALEQFTIHVGQRHVIFPVIRGAASPTSGQSVRTLTGPFYRRHVARGRPRESFRRIIPLHRPFFRRCRPLLAGLTNRYS